MMDAVVEGEGQFLSVQGKAAASDAVGVSADHGADKASLVFVVHRVFKAQDHIYGLSVFIGNDEGLDHASVGEDRRPAVSVLQPVAGDGSAVFCFSECF